MLRFVKIDLIFYGRGFILVICKHSYMVSPCYKLKNFIVYGPQRSSNCSCVKVHFADFSSSFMADMSQQPERS